MRNFVIMIENAGIFKNALTKLGNCIIIYIYLIYIGRDRKQVRSVLSESCRLVRGNRSYRI